MGGGIGSLAADRHPATLLTLSAVDAGKPEPDRYTAGMEALR
jgi:hypothetical protein